MTTELGIGTQEPPTLMGWRLDWPIVVVWCPECRHYHSHGWGFPFGDPNGGGHRVAHCHRTGGMPQGYFLPPDPQQAPPHIRRDMRRRRPIGPAAAAAGMGGETTARHKRGEA